jgi:RimJ/RimL family protein N-acetyltransferase
MSLVSQPTSGSEHGAVTRRSHAWDMGVPPVVRTARFAMIPFTSEMKDTYQRSRSAFEAALGAELPDGWPQFPHVLTQKQPLGPPPWCGYLFVLSAARKLIGNGGFKAAPDPEGDVEIGYEIAPAYRNLGYATEAVEALIGLAFDQGANSITATSLPERNASNAVMQNAGMQFLEEIPNAKFGSVWRFRANIAPIRSSQTRQQSDA